MKTSSRIAVTLVLSPLLAFAVLAVLHPLGDPQKSQSLLIRFLDYQGTYWIRNAIPVPPPLLVVGTTLAAFLSCKSPSAWVTISLAMGLALLAAWALIFVTPMLVHVP